MKRCILLCAVLPLFTGCMYYAYPTASYLAAPPVPNPDGSVHAYRVDLDRTERSPKPTTTEYTLSKLPIDARGMVPSQFEIAPTTGVFDPFGLGADVPHEKSQYTMLVRFYRPGYRTIEVKAWDKSRELQWSPAADLLAQEKAIDDLLADPAAPVAPNLAVPNTGFQITTTWWEMKDQKMPGLGLQPGGISISQRHALEFAAGEYQRLAQSPPAGAPNMQTDRDRLQQKANWLRNFAMQAPTR